MKRLLVVILVLAVGWSGYWVLGARGSRAAFEAWFADRRAEGWQADYSALTLRGFPNRFDTTLDNPALADPDTGLAWTAPFLQIFALSYRPNHIIAVWPNQQQFSTPTAKYDLSSADMRASLVMLPEPALPVERANLVATTLVLTTDNGQTTRLAGVQAALTRTGPGVADYRLALNVDGLTPPAPARVQVTTGDLLPDQLSALRADFTLGFDRPWDIHAIETGRPQPTRIRLKLAQATWGQLELMLAGTLDIDAVGRPSGRLTLKARNWRDILHIVDAMGWLPAGWTDRLEQGLALAAQLSGNTETLDIPLDFSGGAMALGPIPLGPAPTIRLR